MSGTEEDRRAAPRRQLAMRVELPTGKAVTRNVSSSGLFLRTDHDFRIGEEVSLTLIFEQTDALPALIPCRGTVVRIDSEEGGVAVSIDAFGV